MGYVPSSIKDQGVDVWSKVVNPIQNCISLCLYTQFRLEDKTIQFSQLMANHDTPIIARYHETSALEYQYNSMLSPASRETYQYNSMFKHSPH